MCEARHPAPTFMDRDFFTPPPPPKKKNKPKILKKHDICANPLCCICSKCCALMKKNIHTVGICI